MPKKLQNQQDGDIAQMNAIAKLMLEQAAAQKRRREQKAKMRDPMAESARIQRKAEEHIRSFTSRLQQVLAAGDETAAQNAHSAVRTALDARKALAQRTAALAAKRAKADGRSRRRFERLRKKLRRVMAMQLERAVQNLPYRAPGRRRPTGGRRPVVGRSA